MKLFVPRNGSNLHSSGLLIPRDGNSIYSLDQGFYENHVFIPAIDITSGIFNFAYNNRGNLTLLSTTEAGLSILSIPSSVNGILVDSIGPAAFYNTPSIQVINFPSTIKYIEENAFTHCNGLEYLEFPEGLIEIRKHAFSYCENLRSVRIPASVNRIVDLAFAECYLLEEVVFDGDNYFERGVNGNDPWVDPFKNSNPTLYVNNNGNYWGSTFGSIPSGLNVIQLPVINIDYNYDISELGSICINAKPEVDFIDIDSDGRVDVAEDIDGDGNLDIGEDVDGDGNLDVNEVYEVQSYQWYYGQFPISADLGGTEESFCIDGIPQNEGYWKVVVSFANGVQKKVEFTVSIVEDSDSDGLRDEYETATGIYSSVTNTGTDPYDSDSDSDGLADGSEVLNYFTDPNDSDSDGDGLSDYEEILYETDPNTVDSDGDQLSDFDEIVFASNPLASDTDNDGISDWSEINEYNSNPLESDTDFDGLDDFLEKQLEGMTFSINNDNTDLLNILNTAGYIQSSEISDLRMGSNLIDIVDGKAQISFDLEQSEDLESWNKMEDSYMIEVPAESNTQFYRFKMVD